MTKEEYCGKEDTYGQNIYRKYKKLTPDQKERIEDLKNHINEIVEFTFRGKVLKMELSAVIINKGDLYYRDKESGKNHLIELSNNPELKQGYSAYPYEF